MSIIEERQHCVREKSHENWRKAAKTFYYRFVNRVFAVDIIGRMDQ